MSNTKMQFVNGAYARLDTTEANKASAQSLAELMRVEVTTVTFDEVTGFFNGMKALRDAVEILSQKRKTKEQRETEEGKRAQSAIKVLRQTLRRVSKKELLIDITFTIKDCICTFSEAEADDKPKRDILGSLGKDLDENINLSDDKLREIAQLILDAIAS